MITNPCCIILHAHLRDTLETVNIHSTLWYKCTPWRENTPIYIRLCIFKERLILCTNHSQDRVINTASTRTNSVLSDKLGSVHKRAKCSDCNSILLYAYYLYYPIVLTCQVCIHYKAHLNIRSNFGNVRLFYEN